MEDTGTSYEYLLTSTNSWALIQENPLMSTHSRTRPCSPTPLSKHDSNTSGQNSPELATKSTPAKYQAKHYDKTTRFC